MIILVTIAAIISLVMAIVNYDTEGELGLIEPFVIFAVVIVNATIGAIQQDKAEKAMDALKKMNVQKAKVIRNGQLTIIPAAELVVGDIVVLESGDMVPADGRLFISNSLKCIESTLTGESVPIEKNADQIFDAKTPIGDRLNLVYSGTNVVFGSAKAIITATGMQTEVGHIATLLNNEKPVLTNLQKKLNKVGKYLSIAALAICLIILVYGLIIGQN